MDLLTISGLTSDQQLIMMAWGVGGSFIVLLIAGMTNRVVIFADGIDLMWTVLVFGAPVIGFVIGATLVPEGGVFENETAAVVVAGIGGVIGLVGCLMTFILSIKHNGFFLGIIIGIFKVMAALLAAVCAIGLLGKIFGKDTGSFAARMMAAVWVDVIGCAVRPIVSAPDHATKR